MRILTIIISFITPMLFIGQNPLKLSSHQQTTILQSHTGKHKRTIPTYNYSPIFNQVDYHFINDNYGYHKLHTEVLKILNQAIPEGNLTEVSKGYIFHNSTFVNVEKRIVTNRNNLSYEILIDENQNIFKINELFSAFTDTTLLVSVFLPDPLTSTKTEYGNVISDYSDSSYTLINDQIQQLQCIGEYNNGQFTLENEHVIIVEESAPVVNPASNSTGNFSFNRQDNGFEDCNIFYHISNFSNYIKDTLGFSNVMNYQIHVDAHGNNNDDNSFFILSTNPPSIYFGDGGVDDGEDTEIIIHEYTHALLHSTAPNSNSGNERKAIDEAIGDYFATSYTREYSGFNWERVFPWDGHNEFWDGRVVNSTKNYSNLSNNKYTSAEIFSAPLMEIYDGLGRQKTDQLIIEASFGFFAGMTMEDAADLIIQKDSILNNGENSSFIEAVFCDRLIGCDSKDTSIITEPSIELDYSIWNNQQIIQLKEMKQFTIVILNALGQVVKSQSTPVNSYKVTLAEGIYDIQISSENQISNFKFFVK